MPEKIPGLIAETRKVNAEAVGFLGLPTAWRMQGAAKALFVHALGNAVLMCDALEASQRELASAKATVALLSRSDDVKALIQGLEDAKAGRCTPFDEIEASPTARNYAQQKERISTLERELADARQEITQLQGELEKAHKRAEYAIHMRNSPLLLGKLMRDQHVETLRQLREQVERGVILDKEYSDHFHRGHRLCKVAVLSLIDSHLKGETKADQHSQGAPSGGLGQVVSHGGSKKPGTDQ